MRQIFLMAALVCFAAMNVNAQTEEPETKGQKFFRLTKTADDNPTDWNAQLEVGHFLLDKENGMYNLSQAAKYYERLYHLAMGHNKEIPDSVIRETGMMLISEAVDKKDLDKALFYVDAMRHAEKAGVDLGAGYGSTFSSMGVLYAMMKGDMVRSLNYMMDFRERLTKDNLPGIEYTDMTTVMLFEGVISKYKEMFDDKLLEVTFDGKKYIIISLGEWNVEKPLMGWLNTEEEGKPVLCDEEGKAYDDLHGNIDYTFLFNKDGVVPKEGSNARLVTVTPERRQQLVKAYHDYLKKAKK